jgi:Xaa-Pro aminopeptidase
MLTKGLSPQELSHVNAVQQDLIRRGEYDRLVKAGSDAGIDIKQIGTETGRELGLPLPAFLSVPLTVFNSVAKRLMLRLDDKLAMEIAREMTDPGLAAKAVKQALDLQAKRQAGAATGAAARETFTRGAMIGSANALAPESRNQNALAP